MHHMKTTSHQVLCVSGKFQANIQKKNGFYWSLKFWLSVASVVNRCTSCFTGDKADYETESEDDGGRY